MDNAYQSYRGSLEHGGIRCRSCQRPTPIRFGLPGGKYLDSYEIRVFWERHPQMRRPPEREIEVAGAVLISFQSLTTASRIDVVVADATFECLDVAVFDT